VNKSSLYLPGLCLLLSACAGQQPAVDSDIAPPAAWQFAERDAAQATNQPLVDAIRQPATQPPDRPGAARQF